MDKQLTVQFNSPALADFDGDIVKIEQGPWPDYDIKTRNSDIASWMMNFLWGSSYTIKTECAYQDDENDPSLPPWFDTNVYVYNYTSTDYGLQVSHGSLSAGVLAYPEFVELIAVNFDGQVKVDYPIDNLISATWQGDVFNEHGVVIPNAPAVVFNGNVAHVDPDIYGFVEVKYISRRTEYVLTVPARKNGSMLAPNPYDCTAFVVSHNSEVEYIDIDAPDTNNCEKSSLLRASRFWDIPGANVIEYYHCGGSYLGRKINPISMQQTTIELIDPYRPVEE